MALKLNSVGQAYSNTILITLTPDDLNSYPNSIYLPKYIEDNSEFLKEEFLDFSNVFHAESSDLSSILINSKFYDYPTWWLSPLVEKSNFLNLNILLM